MDLGTVIFIVLMLLGATLLFQSINAAEQRRFKHVKDLLVLTPSEFEEAIAELLKDLGYRHVQRTGKAARDLAAKHGIVLFDGERLERELERRNNSESQPSVTKQKQRPKRLQPTRPQTRSRTRPRR